MPVADSGRAFATGFSAFFSGAMVGVAACWDLRVFENAVTADLVEIASSAGQTVADDIKIGPEPSARMEGFNVSLQDRVCEATAELRAKNEELVEIYRRVFALHEALARAEQLAAEGPMAASVAHQVGTPLNLISGYVQMIREEEGVGSTVARRLAIVQEQIAKVTSIVRTMMDHARRPVPKRRTDMADRTEHHARRRGRPRRYDRREERGRHGLRVHYRGAGRARARSGSGTAPRRRRSWASTAGRCTEWRSGSAWTS
jgi:signal transduction histidine kinase